MPFASVFRGLGWIFVSLAVLAGVSALTALGAGETGPGARLAATMMLCVFLGGAMLLAGMGRAAPATPRDGVAMLLCAWLAAPFALALPLVGAPGLETYGDAVFDTMAALTTTGDGLMDVGPAAASLTLWRGLLQWAGGFLSIVLILMILAALNLASPGVHRAALSARDEGALFSRFGAILRSAGLVYAGISLTLVLTLMVSGVAASDAIYLGLSAPATSGGLPHEGTLGAYVPAAGRMMLAAAMLAGAMNVALGWQALRDPAARGEFWRDPETRALLVGGGALMLALMTLEALSGRLAPVAALHDAAALVSTTARFSDPDMVRRLPAALILVVTFVGGSAVSAAGGVKIIRMLLLFKHASVELQRVSHPSGVAPMRFRGRPLTERAVVSLWVYFLGYVGALGALVMTLSLCGVGFAAAMAGAVAALSNAGGVLGVTTAQELEFGDFPRAARWVLAFGMALGRMEVLAFVAAFTPGLWRR